MALEDAREGDTDPESVVKHRKEEESDDEFESSEDEDEEGHKDELMSDLPARPEMSYNETLRHLNTEFERLSHFITVGLRGVARTGKEEMWDVLAEMLEAGRREEVRV